MELCRWLASRLQPLCDLEESITSGPGEPHPFTTDSDAQNSFVSHFLSTCLLSVLPPDDMDSLQVEMSGLLKELHCPYKDIISGILKGSLPNAKDHLKFVCM